MTSDDKARRAEEGAGDRLATKLAQIAKAANRRPDPAIPVLNADPAADDPANLWLLADGRLRSRTPDGLVHQYNEFETALPRPAVPTFSTDPIASSGWKIWYLGTPTGQLSVRLGNGNIARFNPTPAIGSMAGGSADLPTPSAVSTVALPTDLAPSRYLYTYAATWARAYCPVHGGESGTLLSYGNASAVHGNRRVMVGFDDAQIRADLAGATVRAVEMRMMNTDSWSEYGGVDISFGTHNASAAPAAFTSVRKDVWVNSWPPSGWRVTSYRSSGPAPNPDHWRAMPLYVGEALRDNAIKGLTIDQPDTVSRSGEFDWSTLSLAITVTS